ncbi:dihydrolipoyllysine-residue succinyltransferase [Alphaproteobacteria bacterium]|nr:dihydrolipoyllysine-residue succinyltransferase [Alphaproteobacteria bacterium]
MSDIKVPELGESIIDGTLTSWLVSEGSSFQEGDNLAEIETEKITIEIPAQTSGKLSKILIQEGSNVKVGEVIAEYDEGEVQSKSEKTKQILEQSKPNPQQKDHVVGDPKVVEAKALDMDIPNFDSNVDSSNEKTVPMSKLRQTIARRLKDAQNTAAILTTFNEVDMSAIMNLRKKQQAAFQKKHEVKLGIMSFFIKACVDVLKEIPEINSEIYEDKIIYKNYFDIGVAIGSEKGLVVPIIRGVEKMSNAEIEKTIIGLAGKANSNKLAMSDLSGGTFSITNGGVYGSMMSTPIINPPQSAILGMHSIIERPIAVKKKIVIRPMMYIALSYDHRLIDGKQAVTFLVRLKEILENPKID